MSCLYCDRLSAQLCNLLLSRYRPIKGGGATNVFQSYRIVVKSSRYRWSKFVEKIRGNIMIGI